MRVNGNLGLLALLATIMTTAYGHDGITVAPHRYNKLLPRQTTSAAPAATSSAGVCKRDNDPPPYLVVREPKPHRLAKRVEKNIPGTSPLVSALKNIPNFAKYATGIVTNRLAHGGIQKHSMVTGLKGVYEFSGKLIIDGQQMKSPMPWIIRWDYDPDKLTHVNAEFGKGSDNPTFAYTFASNTAEYGINYMWDAVSNLIKYAEYDVGTSASTGTPSFVPGTSEQDAVNAIAGLWNQLLNYGCGAGGVPIDNPLNPNAPPT
ncbi:MAG: hypothetical protein Q9191_005605 [Dirinaria sp. TL-2023a]